MILAVLLVFHTYVHDRLATYGYGGELKLSISERGYVSGTYRPETDGSLSPVSGARQGSEIWFDLRTLGGIHVEGTIEPDGSIAGIGTPLGIGTPSRQWVFSATPEATPKP